MRKPHYWKAAGKGSAPSEIVVLDCETWHGDRARVEGGELQTLRLGVALAYRLEGGRRTRVKEITFRTAADFWALVKSRLNDRRPVWVIGHNLPYDLGVVGGWGVITGADYLTQKAAVSGQMFFVKGEWHGKGLNFCDTVNYYRCSLASLGKAVGIPKGEMPPQEASDREWEAYCKQDVHVTAAGVDALIRFVREEHLGPWQPSIASLSFAAYRSRFMREKTLVHCYKHVLRMERSAYYGGVVEVGFVGRVPASPVYELDVCSMFPAAARFDLPTRYKGYSERVGPRRLSSLLDEYSVVAEVEVATPTVQYPCRLKGGTYYPVGDYVTTLADPELRQALAAGHVRYVRRVAWYSRSAIFREYMEYFTGKKGEYRSADNLAFETLCKYYANSLYGKTGQLSPVWREWGPDALAQIEVDDGLPEGTLAYYADKPPDLYEPEEEYRFAQINRPFQVRNYFGVVEVRTRESEARDSCPAIAATITSAARVLLRSYHAAAGAGNWFYSDTDSVWVNAEGKRRLEDAGHVAPNVLGKLDVKGEHAFLHVHGPKDYETDRVVRMKGVRAGSKPEPDGSFYQLHFPGAKEQIKRATDGGVFVSDVKKTLHRLIKKCVVLPTGFTRPLRFPDENPESLPKKIRRKSRN